MVSYEELIKYHDEQTWRDYFEKELGELYSAVKGFLDLRDELVANFSGRPVSEIIAESEEYKKMLFGGVALEDGPFKERALAKFYAEVMGIRVKDLDKVISRLKEGIPLEDATKDVYCEFLETDVLKMVKGASEKLDAIFYHLHDVINMPKVRKYDPTDALSGLKALEDLLNAIRRILPHYNPRSFFIISLYSIPRLFIEKAYPRLLDKNVAEMLENFGITLDTLLEPDIPIKEEREKRSLLGLSKGSVAYMVRRLIMGEEGLRDYFPGNGLFDFFRVESISKFFKGITDEFELYVARRGEELKRSVSVLREEFEDIISLLGKIGGGERFGAVRRWNIKVKGGDIILKDTSINYSKLMTFLSPALFLGLTWFRPDMEEEELALVYHRWWR